PGPRTGAQSELRRSPGRAAITAPVDRQNAEPAVLQLVEPPDLIGYRAGRAVQEQHDAALRGGRRPPPAVEPLAVRGRDLDLGKARRCGRFGCRAGAAERVLVLALMHYVGDAQIEV